MEWRTEEQKPELWRILGPLGTVMNVAGFAAMVAAARPVTRHFGIFCCVVLAVACFALYLRFPAYFSLMDRKTYYRHEYEARVKFLDIALFAPCMALVAQSAKFHIMDWNRLIILTLITTAVIMVVLLIRCREVRAHLNAFVLALMVVGCFSFGVIVNGNHYLNVDPEPPQTYEVVKSVMSSRRKGTSYHCVVELEPGEEERLPITEEQYQVLDGTVAVFRGPGAFGVEYAYIVDIGGETNG